MKRYFPLLFVGLGFLTQCSPLPKESPDALGQHCRAVLPGKWKITSNGDRDVVLYKTFYPDGTAESSMIASHDVGSTRMAMQPIKITSRWRIDGDILTTYQTRAEWDTMFAEHNQFQDKIISVDQDRIVSKSVPDGLTDIAERMP